MVVMVDDEIDFGSKIGQLFFKNEIDFEIWSDYTNLPERLLKSKPSIMLMDLRIGDDPEAGLKALKVIKEQYVGIKTIVLTSRHEFILKALRLGADGFLMKSEIIFSLEYINDVIKDAKSSKYPMTDEVKRALVHSLYPFDKNKIEMLNDREKSIIALSASDKTGPEVAEALNLTKKTVETYLKIIKIKLDCRTIQGVVSKAFYYRILNPEDISF